MTRQALYRFFSEDGALLYVGITARPWERWKQHRQDKPWWSDVATITLESFDTRDAVSAAEAAAIKSEHPRYNVMLSESPPPRLRRSDAHNPSGPFHPRGRDIQSTEATCTCGTVVLPYMLWKSGDPAAVKAAYNCPCGSVFTAWIDGATPYVKQQIGYLSFGEAMIWDELRGWVREIYP